MQSRKRYAVDAKVFSDPGKKHRSDSGTSKNTNIGICIRFRGVMASTNVRALKQLHTTSVEVPLEMFISGRCMEYACERLHLLEMVVLNSLCL